MNPHSAWVGTKIPIRWVSRSIIYLLLFTACPSGLLCQQKSPRQTISRGSMKLVFSHYPWVPPGLADASQPRGCRPRLIVVNGEHVMVLSYTLNRCLSSRIPRKISPWWVMKGRAGGLPCWGPLARSVFCTSVLVPLYCSKESAILPDSSLTASQIWEAIRPGLPGSQEPAGLSRW